jgi:hypothetical protein
MSKKYIYLLLFIIAALGISTLFFKPGFWKKDSSSFDFLIDSMQIMNTLDYVGEPEKSESDKVYIQRPFTTTLFQLSDDSDLFDFYWHITSPSLDTIIKDRESLNYFFINEGQYLVSLCKDEKNCISKWVYVLSQNEYNNTVANNSAEKIEPETPDTPLESNETKLEVKSEKKKTDDQKTNPPGKKLVEEKDMTESFRSTIQDLYSNVENDESTLKNIKKTYPKVATNNDFVSLVNDASQIKKHITDIYNFKKKIFKVGDSQIEPRLGSIQNDYINLRNRIISFTDDIAKNPPVEVKEEKPKVVNPPPKQEDYNFEHTGKAGIKGKKCDDVKEIKSNASITIQPKKPIELSYFRVYSTATCKVKIVITSDGGESPKKLERSVNAGISSELNFQTLGYVMKPGVTYTITVSPSGSEFGLLDLSGCNTGTGSNNDIIVNYGSEGKAFFDLTYEY